MDLSILVEDTIIYIRVAGLIKTPCGFLFEKSKKGYIFALGGKVKLGESSREAIIREIKEELGIKLENFKLISILENFYKNNNGKVQEICFVYEIEEEFTGVIPNEFIEVPLNEINNYDVRPKQIVDLLRSDEKSFQHIIIK